MGPTDRSALDRLAEVAEPHPSPLELNMTNLPAVRNTRPKVCGNDAAAPAQRSRQGKWIVNMFDLNWISAANTNRPAWILSKNRTNHGVEVCSQSTHFTRVLNAMVNAQHNATPDGTWSDTSCDVTCRNTTLRRVIGLLRGSRAPRRQLCELHDHIFRGIGLPATCFATQ